MSRDGRRWKNPLGGLAGLVRAAARDRAGIAAVEFAMVLPVLLLLYIGTTAISSAVSASRATAVLARTLTDLVAQQPANVALTDTVVQDIFNASTAVMAPFSTTALHMTLSNVEFVVDSTATTSNNLRAKTRWTVTFSSGTLRPCSPSPVLTVVANGTIPTSTTMPLGLYTSGFVIVADVSYTYTPNFGAFNYGFGSTSPALPLSYSMSRTSYMRPRQTDNIRYTTGQSATICPISSPQTS